MNIQEKFKGYKTYIVAGLAACVWFATATGLIDSQLATSAYQILAILGTGTIAAKINRLANGGK